MITHTITGSNGTSKILVGESLSQVEHYLGDRKFVIITDENLHALYKDQFPETNRFVVIGTGESIKTLDTVETLYDKFLDWELDRSSVVLAIGGGVVCDIAGFAASTYLRGINFGFVSTTLLAQVDASVGGKNGVNFQGYKNIIGTFNQPEFVLIDFTMLKTLESRKLGCGFAEAIKHGAIADADLFDFMESHAEEIMQLVPQGIERIVNDSIIIKSGIVNNDEKEHGERRKLNFGHTFGHAIEKTLGLPHGESIALGMVVASQLSKKFCGLPNQDAERLIKLLARYHLPVTTDAAPAQLKNAIRKDKKRYGDSIKFVLLERIGQCVIQDVSLTQLEAAIESIYV
jgi:3-dehydroquinate synthase